MSRVLKMLSDSPDALKNDLAKCLRAYQDTKRDKGFGASLGYEPRDILDKGAETVIAERVLSRASGFTEVDPEVSYEAIVLRYSDRFAQDVIHAARDRLEIGPQKVREFHRQDIQFFIKTSSLELLGETGITANKQAWIGRRASIPPLHNENNEAEVFMANGFHSFIWLNEQKVDGENGRGLTALVQFGPLDDSNAMVVDAEFYSYPVGKELLAAHKGRDTFIGKIDGSRHKRTWPITDAIADELLNALERKASMVSSYETPNPDPKDPLNLEKIDEATALRQVVLRRNQRRFRENLLKDRPQVCAICGTMETKVLIAAHIIPYAQRFVDRDKLGNGLLLRSDIHTLFDAHLISINPETRLVEVAEELGSQEYRQLVGCEITDPVSAQSLTYHYAQFCARKE